MNVTRGTMPATRTYCKRWFRWLTLPMLPIDGVLTLGQMTEKKGDVDEQDYGVDELPPVAFGYRRFCVRKLGAPIGGDDDMYDVQVGSRASSCSCTAGRTRNEVCRHRDGLKALIESGALPVKELQGA